MIRWSEKERRWLRILQVVDQSEAWLRDARDADYSEEAKARLVAEMKALIDEKATTEEKTTD